jgi:UDP-N-acetylglucosamine 2-epimerase (non-hydrolysing)
MKLAPLDRALREHAAAEHVIVHTGQHYDREMSAAFFADLDIPEPSVNLGIGSASSVQQTANAMLRLEPILADRRPDVVLVYGDVNSTLAGALVAAKLGIPVGHVEAGLRSRDWNMPEELNRVLTDRVSDLLFTPSRDAYDNLVAEGISPDRVRFVGNIMIDALVHALPRAKTARAAEQRGLEAGAYVVVTLHRPSNVDDPETLRLLMETLGAISREHPVLFPIHPRTRSRLDALHLQPAPNGSLRLLEPLGYIEMLSLVADAGLVITDSGGLQEETSFLGVPCLTARANTERPVTIQQGTNRLVPSPGQLLDAAEHAWRHGRRNCTIELWDGRTAERIVAALGQ